MAQVDRLRIGPWVPTNEPTDEHGLHRPRVEAAATEGPPDWRPHTAQYLDDDAGRRYRGYRRAVRHRPILVVIAALSVIAVVLLVAAALPRHGMRPTAAHASPVSSPVLAGLPATYQADAPVNTLFGVAQTKAYPGASDGVIVRTLGNWGKDGEGALRFNDVVAPVTGTYGLTFYYVLPNNGHRGLGNYVDFSADYQVNAHLGLRYYIGALSGKGAETSLPSGRKAGFTYLEFAYKF